VVIHEKPFNTDKFGWYSRAAAMVIAHGAKYWLSITKATHHNNET